MFIKAIYKEQSTIPLLKIGSIYLTYMHRKSSGRMYATILTTDYT